MRRCDRRSRGVIQRRSSIIAGIVVKLSIIPFFCLLINVSESVVVTFQPTIVPHNSMSSLIEINRPKMDERWIKYNPCRYQQQRLHEIKSFTKSRISTQSRLSVQGKGSRARGSVLFMAGQSPSLSEKEVRKGIDKVVLALRKDSRANQELGKLQRVTIILGSGMQQMDTILAVRFNAAFQKSGPGLSSIPLPFGLGQSNVSEGRGTMVGQVKASINVKTGKVISCSVFRDLGYGRTFDLKV
jgi:hypothetical protein